MDLFLKEISTNILSLYFFRRIITVIACVVYSYDLSKIITYQSLTAKMSK